MADDNQPKTSRAVIPRLEEVRQAIEVWVIVNRGGDLSRAGDCFFEVTLDYALLLQGLRHLS